MLIEWLMERYGWRDVWYLGSNGLRRGAFRFLGPETCYVGIWTGPKRDLLCVRECSTLQEAEACLSPPGWTILHAAFRAWVKLISCAARSSASLCGTPNIKSHNSIGCRDDSS